MIEGISSFYEVVVVLTGIAAGLVAINKRARKWVFGLIGSEMTTGSLENTVAAMKSEIEAKDSELAAHKSASEMHQRLYMTCREALDFCTDQMGPKE